MTCCTRHTRFAGRSLRSPVANRQNNGEQREANRFPMANVLEWRPYALQQKDAEESYVETKRWSDKTRRFAARSSSSRRRLGLKHYRGRFRKRSTPRNVHLCFSNGFRLSYVISSCNTAHTPVSRSVLGAELAITMPSERAEQRFGNRIRALENMK